MRITLLLLIFDASFLLNGQETNRNLQLITILDSATLEPIPFATIKTKKEIFYANEKGTFPASRLNDEKSLSLSCIGYKNKTVTKLKKLETIYLAPQSYQLKKATISAEPPDPIEIGYHKLGHFFPHTSHSTINKSVNAVYIPAPAKSGLITTILLSLNQLKKGQKFNVHLFEFGANGFPANLLFSKHLTISKKTRFIEVEVFDQNIQIPNNGIVVGLEFLTSDSVITGLDQARVNMTTKLEQNMSFFFYDNQWKKVTWPLGDQTWNNRFGLIYQPY